MSEDVKPLSPEEMEDAAKAASELQNQRKEGNTQAVSRMEGNLRTAEDLGIISRGTRVRVAGGAKPSEEPTK